MTSTQIHFIKLKHNPIHSQIYSYCQIFNMYTASCCLGIAWILSDQPLKHSSVLTATSILVCESCTAIICKVSRLQLKIFDTQDTLFTGKDRTPLGQSTREQGSSMPSTRQRQEGLIRPTVALPRVMLDQWSSNWALWARCKALWLEPSVRDLTTFTPSSTIWQSLE